MNRLHLAIAVLALISAAPPRAKSQTLPPVNERFASSRIQESPDFQKHVMPLMGRLGCNGRACHGSFQGRGGFRLSLFGYDFKRDHEEISDGRLDVARPQESLILSKPTNAEEHEGGLRFEKGSWQHRLLFRWVASGAKFESDRPHKLTRLEIFPAEIAFRQSGEQVQLRAVAVWNDGIREDVTPLCRFKTNNESIAEVDEQGRVTSGSPGDSHIVVSYDKAVQPVPVLQPVASSGGSKSLSSPVPTEIDRLVVQKLRKLEIVPSNLSTDEEFLRRVSLDVAGTLPSVAQVEAFRADKSRNKRSRKIDSLLETPGYTGKWTTMFNDLVGNSLREYLSVNMFGTGNQDTYDWIYKRVENNTPYDDLVEGIVTAVGMKPGQSYTEFCEEMSDHYRGGDLSIVDQDRLHYYWSHASFRQVETRAIAFAYGFLGMRIQCAQCHKHPFDEWSKDDFHQFKNFFAKINYRTFGPRQASKEFNALTAKLGLEKGQRLGILRPKFQQFLSEGKTMPFHASFLTDEIQRTRNANNDYPEFDNAKLLGGEVVEIANLEDPRTVVMEWLRRPDNRFFSRAFVNRVWAAYFNVGIVDPPDDLSLANPPSNKPLLDYLAKGFIESGFDMKWLHRTIANSRTYQLSWEPNETNLNDHRNFSHAVMRRLPAEVVFDSIQLATASDEKIAIIHDSNEGRALAVATGPTSDKRNRAPHYAMRVFGRSIRESNCECDRSSDPSLMQSIYAQNDYDIWNALDSSDGWLSQLQGERRYRDESLPGVIEEAYLRALGRRPERSEAQRAMTHIHNASAPQSGVRNLMWALLNTKEFIVNH
jgi:hypothetical protein